MRTATLISTLLLAATARAAHADPWSSRVAGAASSCRSDAQQLRAVAADCRAHSAPPPDGGDYCTGVKYSEAAPDGQTLEYELSPDQAEQIADQFEEYAPTLEGAAERISDLEDAIATTQDKIDELGFDETREDAEGWLALAESSRDALAEETKKFLVARLFDGERLDDAIATLSRGRAEQMAEQLASYGDLGVEAGKALKRAARTTGRRAKGEAAAVAVKALHAVYDQIDADSNLDRLASALGLLVRDQNFGFLVDEIKWTTAAVYAASTNSIAEARLDQLSELQALKLRALKSLTELLHKQVQRVDDEVAPLHGCSYARPSV
jgi:hypothetical protein